MIRPTHALVSLRAIRRNTRAVLDLIGPARKLLVMVKADAYGHGALPIARTALDEGASFLGVALVEEGISLRDQGIDAPILVFTSLMPNAASALLEYNLIPTLSSLAFAEALNRAAVAAGVVHPVHVDVDTGMGRFGFRVEDPNTFTSIRSIAAMKGLCIEGIMTHFASADDHDACDFTRSQLTSFRNLLRDLAGTGIRPNLIHVANTAGILCHPDSHESLVRLGLGLYGYYPDPSVPHTVPLEPCLELVSRIIHLKTCAAGSPIGYGRTFTTARSTRIATVPVGYADGYPRELSNLGKVLVLSPDHNTRTSCAVIGRVCMDDILVDVTDVPGAVSIADDVVIYSNRRQDPNSVESIASVLGTIPYTLSTRLTARVPRVHFEE